MTEGDEYIYTGRIRYIEDINKRLYNFGDRLKRSYFKTIKPLFCRRKSDNNSSSIDKLVNLGKDKELASEKSMKIAFDSVYEKGCCEGVN